MAPLSILRLSILIQPLRRMQGKCTTASTTLQSYEFLNTPHNRRDLRQQALDAIAFIRSNPGAFTDIFIVLICRLAYQSEAAATRVNIESIEKQGIRYRYAGRQAPRASRQRLAAALVVDGKELVKRESDQKEKAAHNAAKRQKGKANAKEPTKQGSHTSSAPLNSAYRS